MNHTSYSQIRTFSECPRKWYLTYGPEGRRPLPTPEMQDGKDVHGEIADWLRDRKGPAPKSIAHYEQLLGQHLLVEKELTMPVTKQLWLLTIIDVYWIEGNKAFIIDWKSGAIPPDDEQLKFYAAAVMYNHDEVEEVVARYCVYNSSKPVYKTYLYGGAELIEFYGELKAKAADIASREQVADQFPMRPTRSCATCAFAATCASQPEMIGAIEPAEIDALIARYHLHQAAADQAHDMIRDWMIERGLSRVESESGEGFEMRLSMSLYKVKAKGARR